MIRRPESVRIEGLNLVWRYSTKSGKLDWFTPTDRSLLQFASLADVDLEHPGAIAAYARRYGVLGAARIKPKNEEPTDLTLDDGTVWRLGYDPQKGIEPLELWKGLACELKAILRINAALKGRTKNPRPQIGTQDDWQVLLGDEGRLHPIDDVRDAQFLLLTTVNEWLKRGGVRLQLGTTGWSKDRTAWILRVVFDGLAGGLAYRLLLMVTGESRLFACDGCGRPYIRLVRAPRPGQENFCEDCTEVARQRAVQRYRRRKESGKGVHT
jgi:hypothetical protein